MFGHPTFFEALIDFSAYIIQKLYEDQRRIYVGGVAMFLPFGGITALQEATGLSRNTISKTKREVEENFKNYNADKSVNSIKINVNKPFTSSELRKRGRPRCEDKQPSLYDALQAMINGTLYYGREGKVYTSLSLRDIAEQLQNLGFEITHTTVAVKLKTLDINVEKDKIYATAQEDIRTANTVEDKNRDAILLSYFDIVVDHFLVDSPEWSFAKFDETVDTFLSVEKYDYFSDSIFNYTEFDKVVDSFLSIEEHNHFFSDTSKYTEFDKLVDYFLEDYADNFDLTDNDIVDMVLFLSLFLKKKAKEERIEKLLSGGRKGRRYRRIRKPGGGKYTITEKYSLVKFILIFLIDSKTYGDPEKPLIWTSKSQRKLSRELAKFHIFASHVTVGKLLDEIGCSRKKNRKLEQVGKKHPDADAQMENINNKINYYSEKGVAVISIDCKKKELIGNYANQGSDYCIKPEEVLDHDFLEKDDVKAVPYGIYDVNKNIGYVNVGLSKETPEFAVHSIEKWWYDIGSKYYNNNTYLFITCDGGGSNASISIRFKLKLQEFANKTGLTIVVSHYPPGKSKYNKIEHRLLNLISNNWRGHPLRDISTILNYISSTKSRTGLEVYSSIDRNIYKTGIPTKTKDLRNCLLLYDEFLPQWNYTIYPEWRRKEVIDKVEKQWETIDIEKKKKDKLKREKNKEKKG